MHALRSVVRVAPVLRGAAPRSFCGGFLHNKPDEPIAMDLLAENSHTQSCLTTSVLPEIAEKLQGYEADLDTAVSGLMVLHPDGKLAGILSERDIIKKLNETKWNAKALTAADVMTPLEKFHGTWATPKTLLRDLGNLMSKGHVRHIPVLGDKKTEPRTEEDWDKQPVPPANYKYQGIIGVSKVLSQHLLHIHHTEMWQSDLDENLLTGGGAGAR